MADQEPNGDLAQRTRRRASHLTDEGAALLERTLYERREAHGNSGRIKQQERADLLGVCRPTADRILRRQGVDRNTLVLAFRSLGLEWKDSYSTRSAEQPEPTAVDPAPPLPKRRRDWRVWAGTALLLCALLYVPLFRALDTWGYGRKQRSVHLQLVAEYCAGVREYQAGNFKLAREHCERMMTLSRETRSYYDLAMALRLTGEIASAQGDLLVAKRLFLDALAIRLRVRDLAALTRHVRGLRRPGNKARRVRERQRSPRTQFGRVSQAERQGRSRDDQGPWDRWAPVIRPPSERRS